MCNKFLIYWLVNLRASGNYSGTPFILRYGLRNAKLGFQAMLSCATLRFFSLTDQCYIPISRRSCSGALQIYWAVPHSDFNGRWPSMEDNLQWKTTFGGRRPSMEDDLQWKTTFNGRRPLMEDDLQVKTTFNGRRHLIEYTFNGTRPWSKPLQQQI